MGISGILSTVDIVNIFVMLFTLDRNELACFQHLSTLTTLSRGCGLID
jgi:hypothetical protein